MDFVAVCVAICGLVYLFIWHGHFNQSVFIEMWISIECENFSNKLKSSFHMVKWITTHKKWRNLMWSKSLISCHVRWIEKRCKQREMNSAAESKLNSYSIWFNLVHFQFVQCIKTCDITLIAQVFFCDFGFVRFFFGCSPSTSYNIFGLQVALSPRGIWFICTYPTK